MGRRNVSSNSYRMLVVAWFSGRCFLFLIFPIAQAYHMFHEKYGGKSHVQVLEKNLKHTFAIFIHSVEDVAELKNTLRYIYSIQSTFTV